MWHVCYIHTCNICVWYIHMIYMHFYISYHVCDRHMYIYIYHIYHTFLVCLTIDSKGEHLESLGISQLSKVCSYGQFPHCLPTGAHFHYFVNALDCTRQNLSWVLSSALHKRVGHLTAPRNSTLGNIKLWEEWMWACERLPEWELQEGLFIWLRLCLEDGTGRE